MVVKELPDEVLVYDLEQHKAHCLNLSAAQIWKLCDGRTTVSEITRKVNLELGVPVDEEVVLFALDQLGTARLLQERVVSPGISRRQVIKRLGLVAVAVPLVTSLLAPTAQANLSCKSCFTSADCSGQTGVCSIICNTSIGRCTAP
jgi:hypothetical protein